MLESLVRRGSVLATVVAVVAGAMLLPAAEPFASPALEPVHSSKKKITITGNVHDLAPGVTKWIDVEFRNKTSDPLVITSLTVEIIGIDKKHTACALTNYAVVPYTGPLPLKVPKKKSREISDLGVRRVQRPGITMLNLPWPQNECLGARLTLAYTATVLSARDDDDDDDDHHGRDDDD